MGNETKQGAVVVERWGHRWNVRFPATGNWIPFPSRKKAMAWVAAHAVTPTCPGAARLPLYRAECKCGWAGWMPTAGVLPTQCPTCAEPVRVVAECSDCGADGAHRRAA